MTASMMIFFVSSICNKKTFTRPDGSSNIIDEHIIHWKSFATDSLLLFVRQGPYLLSFSSQQDVYTLVELILSSVASAFVS